MPHEKDFDVVVVGGANFDYLARGPKLPAPGATVQGDLIHAAAGGKGANQAVAAARLRARVAFIGRIGHDPRGDRIADALLRENVDLSRMVRDSGAPTGVALVQVDEAGEKQILATAGANGRMSADDVRNAADIIRRAKVLLLQLEVPLDATREAARLACEAGVKVVLDPAPPVELPDELLRMVAVIKPNDLEAEALTGIKVTGRASARQAAAKLLERGVAAAAVTAGREGNLLVWREGEHWLPRFAVKSIDATGAGDAFAAALGVALAEGRSLPDAGGFANAAAALATTIVGAQAGMPSRDAVLALQNLGSG